MKKSLIFLGLLTLSFNVLSMEEKEVQSKSTPKKQQLSGWEKIKVGGALFGCGSFTWATLVNPSTRTKQQNKLSHFSIQDLPAVASVIPFGLISGLKEILTKKGISNDTGYNLAAASSSILALTLGYYAYKKLTQSNKSTKKNT